MTDNRQGRFTGNIVALLDEAPGALGLDDGQRAQLTAVLRLIEKDGHAPTTITSPRAVVDRHLADSLVATAVEEIGSASSLVDLGAGAGFPGVPLAIALPGASFDLVESQRRKCEFIERLLAAAEVGNAQAVCARAEEYAAGRGPADAVLARALAPQPVVLEYAAPLLRLGGTLVDWRGKRDPAEERAAEAAGRALGLELREIRYVEPFPDATDRHLHIWRKTSETPDRFPRRPGMARKRPLGA